MKIKISLVALLLVTYCVTTKPTVENPIKDSITIESLEYKVDSSNFEGFIAYDKSLNTKRPGVLIIHEWWGLNDYTKQRAKQLADLGYVAFAMDMYGKGIQAKDHEEAAKLSGAAAKDTKAMLKKISKALEILKSNPNVDNSKLGAIGYCFGGMAVIELALDGQDFKGGIVSFHGMLGSPNVKSNAKKIKSKLLVHHGEADPFMPKEVVENFKKSLEDAKAPLTFVSHAGASHGFTRPGADSHGLHGLSYNNAADLASWQSMIEFFKGNFK